MAIKDLISKDNQIEISADHLNKVIQMDQMYYKKLSEIGVESLNIEIEPILMLISGSFDKNKLKGDFNILLKPDNIEWNNKHVLLFQVLDHNVNFEKTFRGILANIGNAVIESIFGKDFIVSMLVAEYNDNFIRVDLDSACGDFNDLLNLIILKEIRCEKDKLILLIQVDPKQALECTGVTLLKRMSFGIL